MTEAEKVERLRLATIEAAQSLLQFADTIGRSVHSVDSYMNALEPVIIANERKIRAAINDGQCRKCGGNTEWAIGNA